MRKKLLTAALTAAMIVSSVSGVIAADGTTSTTSSTPKPVYSVDFESDVTGIKYEGTAKVTANPDGTTDKVLCVDTSAGGINGNYAIIANALKGTDFSNGITVSLDIRPTANSLDWNYLFSVGSTTNYVDATIGFIMRSQKTANSDNITYYPGGAWVTGNKLGSNFAYFCAATVNDTTYTGTGETTKDKWYNITFVYSSTAYEIYLDGVSIVKNTLSAADATTVAGSLNTLGDAADLVIGAGGARGSLENFGGYIDDVKVYNSALTAAQVTAVLTATDDEDSSTSTGTGTTSTDKNTTTTDSASTTTDKNTTTTDSASTTTDKNTTTTTDSASTTTDKNTTTTDSASTTTDKNTTTTDSASTTTDKNTTTDKIIESSNSSQPDVVTVTAAEVAIIQKDASVDGADKGTEIKVSAVADEVVSKVLTAAAKNDKLKSLKNIVTLDLKLENSGKVVQVADGSKVKVTLPVLEDLGKDVKFVSVHRLEDDGTTLTFLGSVEVKDGEFTFETDHFSTYVFAPATKAESAETAADSSSSDSAASSTDNNTDASASGNSPVLGDTAPIAVMVVVALLAAAALAAVTVSRKKNA